jgi:hypothetical protein
MTAIEVRIHVRNMRGIMPNKNIPMKIFLTGLSFISKSIVWKLELANII